MIGQLQLQHTVMYREFQKLSTISKKSAVAMTHSSSTMGLAPSSIVGEWPSNRRIVSGRHLRCNLPLLSCRLLLPIYYV